MSESNNELEMLNHTLRDSEYGHEEALQELAKTVDPEEYADVWEWADAWAHGYPEETEEEIYGEKMQAEPESPVRNVIRCEAPMDDICKSLEEYSRTFAHKETSRMESVTITQLVYEKMITELDAELKEASSCDEAVAALSKKGVSFSIGTSPEVVINSTLGDFSHPVEGGAVIRVTVQAGTIQYKILKDALIGKDYWVQITAR